MTGTDFAGIFLVVVKIFFRQQSVFVADQAVLSDTLGIEFQLQLDILCDRHQSPVGLANQNFLGFGLSIDERIVAVSTSADLFQHGIVVVAHSKTQHRQKDTAFGFLFDHSHQRVGPRQSNIKVSISAQNHAVHAIGDKLVTSQLVGQRDAFAASRAAAGGQF